MAAKSKPKRAPEPGFPFPELLAPITPDKPCGDDLEYDPEFILLLAKATPRPDAQYGDFVSAPEAVNWADLERDCRRLLLRTRDIRVLVLLLRCRTRLDHAAGLRDGLAALARMLETWPDAIHPQLMVDGEPDPAMRANALAALADPEALMQDIRELPITGNAALRLQVRDVERALGVPRPADALAPESVRLQLQDSRHQHSPALLALDEAATLASAIDRWATANLPSDRPDLSPFLKLLSLVAEANEPASAIIHGTEPEGAPHDGLHAASSVETGDRDTAYVLPPEIAAEHPSAAMPPDRDAALAGIRAARQWFEIHEPSSPVALLLRQAETLTGKRFHEVFQAIPADLVERWAQEGP